ncbi:Polyketide synthase, enoylreductase domain-containing protein [Rozella allomycis CSF55]|uniref:Polyketide synthase, enoylreductase domain-containing protein n=1 Tax=Rozella allomycis (strain CSF55) TaxID=988480 RepID=A0A075ATL4_ROZAC|nr:Polyketide synthase, enoylreductase domain-containing protein [Rozella allomycis CSF55]|eukprot:EPZ32065.1 Polyketide synthase, enoylreductase domain-containing protein [Rozella allomycis CSF55]
MRAIVIDSYVDNIEQLKVTECRQPSINPDSDQVLIKVKSAGLNYFDLLVARGRYQLKPSLPFTLGSEFSGVVIATGSKSNLRVGDRVCGSNAFGAFAEYVVLKDKDVIKIPDMWSFEEAAGLYITYPTCYAALVHKAAVKSGEWCLIFGATGGIGLVAMKMAKALNLNVIAVVGSVEKQKEAKKFTENVICYNEKDWPIKIMKITDGKGVDVVIDPVGCVNDALKCVRWSGRIVVLGFAGGKIENVPTNKVLLKNASIHGLYWGNHAVSDPKLFRSIWKDMEELLKNPSVKPLICIEEKNGLQGVIKGLKDIENRKIYVEYNGFVYAEPDKILYYNKNNLERCEQVLDLTSNSRFTSYSGDVSNRKLYFTAQENGKITQFHYENRNSKVYDTFIPRQHRACRSVRLNKFSNYCAAGYDRSRNDNSLLLFNIENSKFDLIDQGCSNEAVISMEWINEFLLGVTLASRQIKIYDTRIPLNSSNAAINSKAIRGFKSDPMMPDRIAGFSDDGIVEIWDLRNTDQSILDLTFNGKKISHVSFSPNRNGLLGVLTSNSVFIDTVHIVKSFEESRPFNIWKCNQIHSSNIIDTFEWLEESSISALIRTSGTFDMIYYKEFPRYGWDNDNKILFERNGVFSCVKVKKEEDDVISVMKNRAVKGYSIDIENNLAILKDEYLRLMWLWIKQGSDFDPGILEDGIMKFLESENKLTSNLRFGVEGYHSDIRECLRKQLNSIYCDEKSLELQIFSFLRDLEISKAIDACEKAPPASPLRLLSSLLKGLENYPINKAFWWQELCQQVVSQLNEPKISAVIDFLITKDFDSFLNNQSIRLVEKILFILKFCENANDALQKIADELCRNGGLHCLLITGFCNPLAFKVCQNYIDKSNDVQSVVLILSQFENNLSLPLYQKWSSM